MHPFPPTLYHNISAFPEPTKPICPSPVRLNCRVHMHFPEAGHLAQSEASHEISEQLLATKISRWLMRQSFSEVQLPVLPMQAPSGQLVHHLHCGKVWEEGGGNQRSIVLGPGSSKIQPSGS